MSMPLEENCARLHELITQVVEANGIKPNSPEVQDIMKLIHELRQKRQELELQNRRIQEHERHLMRSRRLYFRLFNIAPMPIVGIDKDLKVTDLNEAAKSLLGPRRHFLGSSFPDVVQEDSIPDFHRLVSKVAYDGRIVHGEIVLKISVGVRSPFMISVAAVHLEDDDLEGFLLILRDLAEKNKDHAEIQETSTKLEEANVALRVLLEKQEEQLDNLKETVAANKARIIDPILRRLRSSRLNDEQNNLTNLLHENLNKLTIDFANKLSSPIYGLTPRELEVADLIRSGWSSDEISEVLHISLSGVLYHRNNIRKKLNLIGDKERLTTRLRRIS